MSQLPPSAAFVSNKSEAEEAVDAMASAWKLLVSLQKSNQFDFTRSEPKITEMLCVYLQSVSENDFGLTGRWSYETYFVDGFNPVNGTIKERRRTDIEYFSNAKLPSLQLIFEFKKITSKRHTNYVGAEGMGRFTTGSYAVGQPVACMAGIYEQTDFACPASLLATLNTIKLLNWHSSPKIISPPIVFPSVASFETRHTRIPVAKLAAHPYIAIAHLLFPL